MSFTTTGAEGRVGDRSTAKRLRLEDWTLAEGDLLAFRISGLGGGERSSASDDALAVTSSGNRAPEPGATRRIELYEDGDGSGDLVASDPDGDPVSYAMKSAPANGRVELFWAGPRAATFHYRPDPDFFGSDRFTVTVSDGRGGVAEQVVEITVRSVNDAPVATATLSPITIGEDGAVSLRVPDGLFRDVEDGDLPVRFAWGSPAWLSFDPATRTLKGVAPSDLRGDLRVTLTASDAAYASTFARVTLFRAPADAPVYAAGERIAVGGPGSGEQFRPALARSADGGYVVVWDSPQGGVRGRAFDADGVTRGGDFVISGAQSGVQVDSTVTRLGDGYLAAWTNVLANGGSEVYARRLTADGTALGDPFRVGVDGSSRQHLPAAAELPGGGFVLAWADRPSSGATGEDIMVQRFTAAGVAVGPEGRVNFGTAGTQSAPTLAAHADGSFALVWMSEPDHLSTELRAAYFYPNGGRSYPDLLVAANSTAGLEAAHIVALPGGAYAVAWVERGQDGDGTAIMLRRFDGRGKALSDPVQVNSVAAGSQVTPRMAVLEDGFVVTWTSPGGDGDGAGVFSKRFDLDGVAQSGEVRVDGPSAGGSGPPSVIGLENGGYIVAWVSDAGDGLGSEIGLRRFDQVASYASGTMAADALKGTIGHDRLSGLDGDDRLEGSAGNDVLVGGAGDDMLDGGSGTDAAGYRDAAAAVTVNLLVRGKAQVRSGAGADVLIGIEDVLGSAFDDHLSGSSVANRLDGGDGADLLIGHGGDDVLVGGLGADRMRGGSGADLFRVDAADSPRSGHDHILDFRQYEGDRIDLSGIGGLRFIGGAVFSRGGNAGELRFRVAVGATWVEADLNGDRVADLTIRLAGEHDLTAGDFVF